MCVVLGGGRWLDIGRRTVLVLAAPVNVVWKLNIGAETSSSSAHIELWVSHSHLTRVSCAAIIAWIALVEIASEKVALQLGQFAWYRVTWLILARLDYCNSVLCGAPVSSMQKLQRVQNNALCSQNRPPGTEAVPCQTADASTTLAAGPTQNWLQGVCVDIQDSEHVCTAVPQPTHQPPCQCTDTTLDGYATAHPTVRWHRLRETFWNSLPASVIGSDSLSVFKSRLKHSYFASPITSRHNRLPPARLKLGPYGSGAARTLFRGGGHTLTKH